MVNDMVQTKACTIKAISVEKINDEFIEKLKKEKIQGGISELLRCL